MLQPVDREPWIKRAAFVKDSRLKRESSTSTSASKYRRRLMSVTTAIKMNDVGAASRQLLRTRAVQGATVDWNLSGQPLKLDVGMSKPASRRPPASEDYSVTFPSEHILLVTITREKLMNSITHSLAWQLESLFDWFESEATLRVAIITGQGMKAFCAGSDLLEIESTQKTKVLHPSDHKPWEHSHPPGGFAGLSRRKGKKPILAAVNGLALGGGFEIVLNCDISVASPIAKFGLPEPLVGVYAYGGGLPRLVRAVGLQTANDIALTGRRVDADEALKLGLISAISRSPESLVEETISKAKQIAAISPDGIIVTRAALREAWETASVERAFQIVHDNFYAKLMDTPNSAEGLAAFREKRQPRWIDSKL